MTKVYFKPWIGENYNNAGFNGKRILILGESCYCGNCPECDGNEYLPDGKEGEEWWEEGCRKKTPEVVTKFLGYKNGKVPYEPYMNGYRKFTDIFIGHECTPEETQKFWNSFVLYNYIQKDMKKPRNAPKQEDWDTGKEAFFEVFAEYNPDVVIAWSEELWKHMPTGYREDKSFLNRFNQPEPLRYYNNGKRDIPVYGCYHPSHPNFSNEETSYFKRLMEKITIASK